MFIQLELSHMDERCLGDLRHMLSMCLCRHLQCVQDPMLYVSGEYLFPEKYESYCNETFLNLLMEGFRDDEFKILVVNK